MVGVFSPFVEYTNANHITVSFESGYTTVTSAGAIRSGGVKDKCNPTIFGVGYVGDGKHKPYYNSRTQSPAYTVGPVYWNGVMVLIKSATILHMWGVLLMMSGTTFKRLPTGTTHTSGISTTLWSTKIYYPVP